MNKRFNFGKNIIRAFAHFGKLMGFQYLILIVFLMISFCSCGLMQGTQVLNTPTALPLSRSATLSSTDVGQFFSYGVDFYYKIYSGTSASDQTVVDAYYSDFLNIWTPNAFSPSTAATNAKYFRVMLLSSTSTSPPVPSFSFNNPPTNPSWVFTIDCAFDPSPSSPILAGIGIISSTGDQAGPFYRNVLRSTQTNFSNSKDHKSFVFQDFTPGDSDISTPTISGNYIVGIIAMTNALVDAVGTVQYSAPVQVGLFNIPTN